MYFTFGNYVHPAAEVNLTAFEVTPRFSPRGREVTRLIRLHLSGLLIASTQATLNTKIAQLIDAYSLQDMDQNCGLYHDDGTVTRHRLESSTTNANNISGVRLSYRSWPKGEPEEYATGREFYIILEAEYKNLEGQIVNFHETVRKVGTGGPRFRYVEYASGRLPDRQLASQFTVQEIVQEGFVEGFDGYVVAPGPLIPSLEDQDRRVSEAESPKFNGRQFSNYINRWRYIMTAPTDQTVFPNIV